ncbi:GTD2A protein, partial [Polyodon spathula]|nr:GTD2A protein [Polyodon spathula]
HHCILHQGALCGKVLKMYHIMVTVVKTLNFIREKGLNRQQFQKLKKLNAQYGDLLHHTEVRWFSRGAVLTRFFELRQEIDIFMQLQKVTTEMYDGVKALRLKLHVWEKHMQQGNLSHFLTNPFDVDLETAPEDIQMELTELQCYIALKAKFDSVLAEQFYPFLPATFPQLRIQAARFMSMFGSTYFCEQLFSLMKINKSAQRSHLNDKHLHSVLKIVSAQNMNLDIDKLVS